jgi:hypothetical protein
VVTAPAPVVCPLCGADLRELSELCPTCRGDLRPLRGVANLADHHFNEAVRAARTGRWSVAAEHHTATLAISPRDVDAMVLLGKVRYRQARYAAAAEIWRDARDVAGALPSLARAIEIADSHEKTERGEKVRRLKKRRRRR